MAVFCFVFSSLHGQSYVFVGFCRHIYWKFWSRNSDTSILRGSFRETCEPLLRVSSFEHTMISKLHSNPKGDGQVICNYRKYLRPKSPKQRQPEHLIRVIRVLSTSHLMIQYDPIIFQMQPDHGGWPSKDDGWFAKNWMKGTYAETPRNMKVKIRRKRSLTSAGPLHPRYSLTSSTPAKKQQLTRPWVKIGGWVCQRDMIRNWF